MIYDVHNNKKKISTFLVIFSGVHFLDTTSKVLDRKCQHGLHQCLQHFQFHPGSKSSIMKTEHLPNVKMGEWNPHGPNHSGKH